jgi:predicted nuclease of predicted toxin-antitoxin system
MKFLLDQNQSTAMAALLAAHGHDTVHVRDIGLSSAEPRPAFREVRDVSSCIVRVALNLSLSGQQPGESGCVG